MKKYPVTWNHSLDEIYSGVTPTVPSLYSTVLHDLNVFKSNVKNKKNILHNIQLQTVWGKTTRGLRTTGGTM